MLVLQAVLNDGTTASPQRCAALLPSSSSRADGCPEYWYKDGKRFNYRQTYIILPTDGGSECNAAGEPLTPTTTLSIAASFDPAACM